MLIDNYSQATDVGLMRENNEDAILSNPGAGLWLVADGMGGHAAGEVASQITSTTIDRCIQSGDNLESAILSAHHAIHQAVKDGSGKYGMGSTVIALKSTGKSYQIGWVGDSRAYSYSKSSHLKPLSIDHSYVQMLYQSGMISADEMESHPERNIITQCLGSNDADDISVDTLNGIWKPNELILLCSDGLTDIVSDEIICEILEQTTDLSLATRNLIEAALKNGGKDNISVILVQAPARVDTLFTKTFLPILQGLEALKALFKSG